MTQIGSISTHMVMLSAKVNNSRAMFSATVADLASQVGVIKSFLGVVDLPVVPTSSI